MSARGADFWGGYRAKNEVLAGILDTLALERLEHNLMRGGHGHGEHVFGGEVLAQALVAARQTLDEDRIRNGRSFTTRRVKAIQDGEAILNLACSFHRDERGFEHAQAMPAAPLPEELGSVADAMREQLGGDQALRENGYAYRFEALEMRPAGDRIAEDGRLCGLHWVRVCEHLPDERFLHAVLLAYISDMEFLDLLLSDCASQAPNFSSAHSAMTFENMQCFSLDHALWFHRDFRVDDWLLFDKEAVSAQNSRGLVRGRFFNRDGQLVASVVQECLIRRLHS